jgi:hypothetical protein
VRSACRRFGSTVPSLCPACNAVEREPRQEASNGDRWHVRYLQRAASGDRQRAARLTSGHAVIFYLTVYITVLLVISSCPPTVTVTTISGREKKRGSQ